MTAAQDGVPLDGVERAIADIGAGRGAATPAASRSSVVLPLPLGPRTMTTSPGPTVRSAPSRTGVPGTYQYAASRMVRAAADNIHLAGPSMLAECAAGPGRDRRGRTHRFEDRRCPGAAAGRPNVSQMARSLR